MGSGGWRSTVGAKNPVKDGLMKVCSRCKVEKDEGEFGRRPSRASGRSSHCKSCLNKFARDRRAASVDPLKAEAKRLGEDLARDGMRRCTRCKGVKSEREFNRKTDRPSGLSSHCKVCFNKYRKRHHEENRERDLAYGKKYRKKNSAETRLRSSRYWAEKCGHAPCNAIVKELEASWSGTCDVCGTGENLDGQALSMDHCHKSGDFRGWLCKSCNRALGFAGDSAERLLELAMYLEKHRD